MSYEKVVGSCLTDKRFQHFKYSFENAFLKSETEALCDNEEFMLIKEVQLVLKNVRELTQIQLYQNISKSNTISTSEASNNTKSPKTQEKRREIDQEQLNNEIQQLDRAIQSIKDYTLKRLEVAAVEIGQVPRMVTLCHMYKFSDREADLFTLLTVVQGSHHPLVLNTLLEEDYMRRLTGFKRITCMSEGDMEWFSDGERGHIKESVVMVDEENSVMYNLRLQNSCVQLLYGRKVRGEDLLKISQTSLETIILGEGGEKKELASKKRTHDALGEDDDNIDEDNNDDDDGNDDEDEDNEDVYSPAASASTPTSRAHSNHNPPPPKLMRVHSWGPGGLNKPPMSPPSHLLPPSRLTPGKKRKVSLAPSVRDDEEVVDTVKDSVNNSTTTSASASAVLLEGEEGKESLPYPSTSQLEYLEDCFQLLVLMIKNNAVKLKDEVKKEGGGGRYPGGDGWGEVKHSKRELTAKIRLQEHRILRRIAKTREMGLPVPRLEEIVDRFGLDSFEKGVILLLIGKTVSPLVRTLLDTLDTSQNHSAEDYITVSQALNILCQSFNTQIYSRKYFYQNSRLLINAIVSLSKPRWHAGSGDLTENKILLDRRMLDYLVGLDSEINELVEGSDLYTPNTPLQSLVLADETKTLLLSQCQAYDLFTLFKRQQERLAAPPATFISSDSGTSATSAAVNDKPAVSYSAGSASVQPPSMPPKRGAGHALVILLCGVPGTGKTMTVNALATELKKKVLLCDFNSLMNKKDSSSSDIEVDLKGLFRESKLSNAVLFFDECEHIFKNRNYSSDRLINSILVEIERHEGIVFLATNRAYELDEAMHRRITMVIEYSMPDKYRRKVIWENLLKEMTTEWKDESSTNTGNGAMEDGSDADHTKTNDSIQTNHLSPLTPLHNMSNHPPLPSHIYLSPQVETSILASKYALTGGFIKNAVLSAILMALARYNDTVHKSAQSSDSNGKNGVFAQSIPLITQHDLITACRLQMRGNLYPKTYEHRTPSPRHTLGGLFLPPSDLATIQKMIRYEQTRTRVYGSWSMGKEDSAANKLDSSSSSSASSAPPDKLTEKANMVLLGGVEGSGKMTVVESICNALGIQAMKVLHIGDFLTSPLLDLSEVCKLLVRDAHIQDACICIMGFELLLGEDGGVGGGAAGGGGVGERLYRVLEILHDFHGLVFLVANVEHPQNVMLHRDLSSRLFSFLRLSLPPADLRAKLWKALLPPNAPLQKAAAGAAGGVVDFTNLGRRFELYPGEIGGAVRVACAEVAARGEGEMITQKDLMAAGEHMINKCKGEHGDMISKLFS